MRYGNKEIPAETFYEEMIRSKRPCHFYENDFLKDIAEYANWIGYDKDIAYVFLLRDAFLPYVYFLAKSRQNLYPWLIGRSFLNTVAGAPDADDKLRLPIYEALENGIINFNDLTDYCKNRMLKTLQNYPHLKSTLRQLLDSVDNKRICVVETGYCGTIPLLLSALDDRVDFKLFTTAPFLRKTYTNKIFCDRYEDLHKFETLVTSEALFKFSSYRGKFFVNVSEVPIVLQKALGEIFEIASCK